MEEPTYNQLLSSFECQSNESNVVVSKGTWDMLKGDEVREIGACDSYYDAFEP